MKLVFIMLQLLGTTSPLVDKVDGKFCERIGIPTKVGLNGFIDVRLHVHIKSFGMTPSQLACAGHYFS